MRLLALLAVYAGVLVAAGPEDVFQAIRNNHLEAIKGANLAVRDRRGNTPLIYAAGFGSPKALALLLDAGAGVNDRNNFEATALVWAAATPVKARMLLAHGADVNARTRQGRTPLMVAAACDGCSEIVRELLAKGADAKAADNGGSTALELAAGAGDAESVRLLLAAGAPAGAASKAGSTPLLNAVFNCDLPSIRMLLAKGANPNAKVTNAGQVKFGVIQLVNVTPLLTSAAYCSSDVVKALIDAGGDVNTHDIRGMTPLMLGVASETQDAAIVRLLVHAGADVNAKSTAGETTMDWARKYGDPDVLSILKAEGAHPAAQYTPPTRPKSDVRPATAAVESATSLLQRTAIEFFQQSGCVGCHHQSMALLAVNAARAAKVHVDEAGAAKLVNMIVSEFTPSQDNRMQRFDPGGGADGQGYSMLALAGAGYAPDAVTDTIAVHTAAMQHRAGNWHVGDASRAPIQESEIARTARGMRTLQLYGPPALKTDFDARIGRARDWLLAAHPKTNDDLAMQLVGLHWAGVPREKIQSLGRTLLSAQREDGGWSQNRNLASDAYATGEALWALGKSGIAKPTDAAYRRGVRYLLSTQWPDGSWYVRSRAPKFQPYFQSGFPFDHDQWVSSAATAWAVMALAPAIETEKGASK
jgi:ankyrin repeat protein